MEIKQNKFTRLFDCYGWTVEQLGDNSYVADNGTFFVAFSVHNTYYGEQVLMGESYLFVDKEEFIQEWKRISKGWNITIGSFAYSGHVNRYHNFTRYGGVGNHDHSTWEIESWLKRLEER